MQRSHSKKLMIEETAELMDQIFGKEDQDVKPKTFTISQQNKNFIRTHDS